MSTGIVRCDLCKKDIRPVHASDTWGIGGYGDHLEIGTVVARRGFWAWVFQRGTTVQWSKALDAHPECIDRLFAAKAEASDVA